jgi:hemoglobin
MTESELTFYDKVGGEPFFTALVDVFYREVATDAALRALYPDEDLTAANERFRLFLMQYWGGPTTYSDERGHPRLRMRHGPYAIDVAMRDRWLRAMAIAIEEQQMDAELEDELWRYISMAAISMVNTGGDPVEAHFSSTPPN